ncbi:MAG: CHASE3 domain-containing protein [Brevundimonas sp.]|uniref:sensor histidine kinase n=1 Tax=Brevundimonas sp. TaxID=1871086 RepID=UPI0027325610|nr:sensor histidine kinase [Brevundimonas sp.]MDP3377422.1 CHASE3 domain-containing protein [Brevundimonas sp.]
MSWEIRENLTAFSRFLRTASLGRSLLGLLSLALVLLLVVNLATFLMIGRTAQFNESLDRSMRVQVAARDVLTRLVDAETGQRGYLLTGRQQFLAIHEEAIRELPLAMQELDDLTAGDAEVRGRVNRLRELTRERLSVMDASITLARGGRTGDAVQIVRDGRGKELMDAMRSELDAIDAIESERFASRRQQSEWSARATIGVNAMAGVLVLMLAGIVAWIVLRYLREMQAAHYELDRINANLENEVRDRTGDLIRANEEVQRFAYIVSHDLRAPLVNVMGYTSELEQAGKVIDRQMAKVETEAPDLMERDALVAVREDVPEAISFIRASTEKMDRLINAILKLSRDGRRVLSSEPINMTAMVGKIADSVNHQTESAGAEIEVAELPGLTGDRLSLEQIFSNMIDNAVKYLDPKRPGRIRIEGQDLADGMVEYRIIDNGRGISDRDHQRIFELFRRSGKQDQPGEGLGLAFVKNSIGRMGGAISVESRLGEGSTFILKFPKRLYVSENGTPS